MDGKNRTMALLYRLTDQGAWTEVAGGALSHTYSAEKEGVLLTFSGDGAGTAEIPTGSQWSLANEKVFTWKEEGDEEFALSFDFAAECDAFISAVSGYLETALSEESRYYLPETVSLKTMPAIAEILRSAVANTQLRNLLLSEIAALHYLPQLLKLFAEVKDTPDADSLREVTQSLVELGSMQLVHALLTERYIYGLVDILSPNRTTVSSGDFAAKTRLQCKNKAANRRLWGTCQEIVRTQYVRDNIKELGRTTEAGLIIQAFIKRQYHSFLYEFEANRKILEDLVDSFLDPETASVEKGLVFFREALVHMKAPFLFQRCSLLGHDGLGHIVRLCKAVLGGQAGEEAAAVDIIHSVAHQDSSIFRDHIVAEEPLLPTQKTLFIIIKHLAAPGPPFLRENIIRIFKVLFDEVLDRKPKEDFLNTVYPQYAIPLFEKMEAVDGLQTTPSGLAVPEEDELLYSGLLGVLETMVAKHGLRAKNFFLRCNILKNTALFLKAQKKHLRVSAVQTLRSLLHTGDEFYYRFLCENNIPGAILDTLGTENKGGSLLSAAILEFFAVVKGMRSETVRAFVTENHGEKIKQQFASITLFSCFRKEDPVEPSLKDTKALWLCIDRKDCPEAGEDGIDELLTTLKE
ncbi:MAG: uncharacterized protein A8A55_0732 [Amphiamblys sp. WSBS2006]|nr:MAG: uncharacterized protein A8A55_0732 [Amphiamblys sp. WSBS2006]